MVNFLILRTKKSFIFLSLINLQKYPAKSSEQPRVFIVDGQVEPATVIIVPF